MAANIFFSGIYDFQPDVAAPTSGVKDSFGGRVKRILTSTVLLLAAYLIAFLLHQYLTGLLCIAYGYHPVISYNHIDNLPMDYREWTLWRITIIFSSGPLMCLILGIFFLDFFNSMSGSGTLLRCFVLWCAICFLNLFLSFLLVSSIAVENYSSNLYTGFSIVGAWWRLGKILMIPFSFVAMTGSIMAGYMTSDMFMKFSFSRTLIDTNKGKINILLQLYLLPVLVAAPFILWLSNEKSFLVHTFHLVNLLFIALGLFMGAEGTNKEMRVFGKDILNTIPVFWLALAGALIGLIMFVLK